MEESKRFLPPPSSIPNVKKRKVSSDGVSVRSIVQNSNSGTEILLQKGCHPYGVKPVRHVIFLWHAYSDIEAGNYYLSSDPELSARSAGLGHFFILNDELILQIISLLPAKELGTLCQTSKIFYAFSHHDELWRSLTLEDFEGNFSFNSCWKDTYAAEACKRKGTHFFKHKPILVKGVYSDLLYRPWLCASMGLNPKWLEHDNVERRSNLSLTDFIRDYEIPGKPVIITDIVTKWPAMFLWTRPNLIENFGDRLVTVGPVEMSLKDYFNYSRETKEENPLYLFDKRFAQRIPELSEEYTVPPYFVEDMFSLLGENRPEYRWLIIGATRSGSRFHIDPNRTSAWNAVVKGRKKWVFYPPHMVPPGVYPSNDGAEVTSPVSLGEWFLNFYKTNRTEQYPLECIHKEGEVIFVPTGWWHAVLNLEDDTIAITQNFVSPRNAANVAVFLKTKPEQISGICDKKSLFNNYENALKTHRPDVWKECEAELQKEEQKRVETERRRCLFNKEPKQTPFRFNFLLDPECDPK